MAQSDKIDAVSRMQKYMILHLDEEITLDDVSRAAGYSKYHAVRAFKELTGRTPYEYVRGLRLTNAAKRLRDSGGKVLDVALQSGFDSHDGFTRAFARQFGIKPQRYRRETPPVPYFVHYPIESYYLLKGGYTAMEKERVSRTVTATAVERPARKLILLRAKRTTGGNYLAFCEEMGCDSDGLLNSIPERFASGALLTLPPNLVKPGTSDTAAGVEVPMDYSKPIPDGYDIIELPPCTMLFFQGAPFEHDEDWRQAIDIVWKAMNDYDPTQYGWRYAPELAPRFSFGALRETGARVAVPIEATKGKGTTAHY